MNKLFTHTLIFCLFSVLICSKAQQLLGNEWIDYKQTYLRIPIAETADYLLNAADLQRAGFPSDTANAAGFQMFRRGRAVDIEISRHNNQITHISFHGERNDGALDTALYVTPSAIPHLHYSLYSDTSAYFLTWRPDILIENKQNTGIKDDSAGYQMAEIEKCFVSHYAPGNFYPKESGFNNGSALSTYDMGEGWTGPEVKEHESFVISLSLENAITDQLEKASIELVVTGRSAGEHSFELWSSNKNGVKRMLEVIQCKDYQSVTTIAKLAPSDFNGQELNLTLVPKTNKGSISASYIKLHYPQKKRQKQLQARPVLESKIVTFSPIDPEIIDFLIITHPAVRVNKSGRDPVMDYAAYRASPKGGSYKPFVVNSEEVYNMFNYGEPGPLGIKKMISWLLKAKKLKFVFLIGQSIDPQTARKLPDPRARDMVPNAGWPGSDISLVTDYPANLAPGVAIGRLNASHAGQVSDYLKKVKALEAEPATASWRKNIVHLSGGQSQDERDAFLLYVHSFEQQIANAPLAARVKTIVKETDAPVSYVPISSPLNDGASLLTLFGHSSLDVTDMDIGLASDPKNLIRNHPRYPAIIVNGCASGSIFYSKSTLSSDWIFSPDNGAVLFLAHTFNGLSTSLHHYTGSIYEVLADSNFSSEPFGIIQKEAIRRNLTIHHEIADMITSQQMLLHGDPAIRIFPSKLPDYVLQADDIQILDKTGNPLHASSDSILIKLIVRNNGRFRAEHYAIRIVRHSDINSLVVHEAHYPSMRLADTLVIKLPNVFQMNDDTRWDFRIDPENHLTEETKHNNALEKITLAIPILPDLTPPILFVKIDERLLQNVDYVNKQPNIEIQLTDDNRFLIRKDTSGIAMWITNHREGSISQQVYFKNATWESRLPNVFVLKMHLPFPLEPGDYSLLVVGKDLSGNDANPYDITFKVSDLSDITNIGVSPNPSDHWFKFYLECGTLTGGEKWTIMLFDQSGRKVKDLELMIHSGKNELLWIPENLSSGVYTYKLELNGIDRPLPVEVQKALQGKLIWIH